MAHEELLAATEFFSAASPEVLLALSAAGHERSLIRGDILFREADPADALYVVMNGRLAIAIANPIDNRETVVSLMEAGELFGALEPSTVLSIPYDAVLELFRKQPDLLWGVTRMLAQRLRAMDETLADSVFLDVTGRTAKRLLELSEGADEFTLPVTQEELAGRVGASRERVNKAIASFIRLGWIEQHERRYSIRKRESLQIRAR